MLKTFLAILIIFIPFILVFNFKNRFKGFLVILLSLIFGHTLIALLTQFFHIFSYPIILLSHLFIAILAVFFFLQKRIKSGGFKFSF